MGPPSLDKFYQGFWIAEPKGNNAFSFEERAHKKIFVPPLIRGTPLDVVRGEEPVFGEIVAGQEVRVAGLKHFVHIEHSSQDIFIFDNHNHAFFFWCWAAAAGKMPAGLPLVHVDQHRDMREPESWPGHSLAQGTGHKAPGAPEETCASCALCLVPCAPKDLELLFNYSQYELNVGNFIPPALHMGLFKEVIHVASQSAFDSPFPVKFILDIDLDVFAPIMSYVPDDVKVARLREMIPRAPVVTIASSPFFLDQFRAVELVRELLV